MRKIATLRRPVKSIRRVMICERDGGAYLFLYTSIADGPCEIDHWYESSIAAEEAAGEMFGLRSEDWIVIDDPVRGAQHDWINPTRVKCDGAGKKIWGEFEPIPPAE